MDTCPLLDKKIKGNSGQGYENVIFYAHLFIIYNKNAKFSLHFS